MTARVINDPSALGWEYDPDTGRWTWGGGSSSGGGGGNGTFPEAPVDGQQYARQDAGWAVVVHPDTGGGDVDLSAYYTKTESDNRYQIKGNYLTSESDPTVPQHVKDITQTDIANWNAGTGNGGGGGVDPRITDTQITNWDTAYNWGNHGSQGYLTSASLNGYATQTWVSTNYQPKGSYLTSESDPTVPSWVKSITQNDINNWNNPPSGGNDYDGSDAVKLTGDQTIAGIKTFSGGVTYFQNLFISGVAAGGVGLAGSARIEFTSGATTVYSGSNTLQVNAGGTSISGSLIATGVVQGTDCIATSDERLKTDVQPCKVGVVTQLNGVDFVWKQSEGKASGVIAQRVKEIPELEHLVHYNDNDGHYGVSYLGLIPYLLEEIKALQSRVEELENG